MRYGMPVCLSTVPKNGARPSYRMEQSCPLSDTVLIPYTSFCLNGTLNLRYSFLRRFLHGAAMQAVCCNQVREGLELQKKRPSVVVEISSITFRKT